MANKYKKLFDLFTTASSHLKYPKISFESDHGEKVQLYLATKGYIAIKVNGEYVGKIQPYQAVDGFEASFRMYQGTTELQNNVNSFCLDPLPNAVVKGQKFGRCCFCGLELTNKASLQMGYGPICADNYGLPWTYTEIEEPLAAIDTIPSPGIIAVDQYHIDKVIESIDNLVTPLEEDSDKEKLLVPQQIALYKAMSALNAWIELHK